MSEWYTCQKCGATRENMCACPNIDCADFNGKREKKCTQCGKIFHITYFRDRCPVDNSELKPI